MNRNGRNSSADGRGREPIGASRSRTAVAHDLRAHRVVGLVLQLLAPVHERDALASGEPEHREEAHERADRDEVAVDERGHDAAGQRTEERHEHQQCQQPAAQRRLEQQEDAEDRREAQPDEEQLVGRRVG